MIDTEKVIKELKDAYGRCKLDFEDRVEKDNVSMVGLYDIEAIKIGIDELERLQARDTQPTKSASEKLIEMGYKLSDSSPDMEEWEDSAGVIIKIYYRSSSVAMFARVDENVYPVSLTKDELEVCLQRLKEVESHESPIAG